MLEQALEIRRLEYGSTYAPVKSSECYTVDSCLRILRDYGTRLFFALGLSLSPAEGYSFADGVDLQISSVEFANNLPKAECAEWKERGEQGNFVFSRRTTGLLSSLIAFVMVVYSIVSSVAYIIPSTACMPAFGGSGCSG